MKKENKIRNIVSEVICTMIALAIAACVIIFQFLPNAQMKIYRIPNEIYAEQDTSDGLCILEPNGTEFAIYHIYSDKESSTNYGYKTVYQLDTSVQYNKVLWRIYCLPDSSAPFWKRFAFYDDSIQEKAYVEFHAVEEWGWHLKGDVDDGKYYAYVTQRDDSVTIGKTKYLKISEGTELRELVDLILTMFNSEAQKLTK